MTEFVQIEGEGRPGAWVVTCDHAGRLVPPSVGGGDIGLPAQDMARHISHDIGAAGVATGLAKALDSPVILNHVSRLVIDANRGEADPTLLMRLYDATIIPANRHADAAEIERRLEAYHRPYHRALARLAGARAGTALLAVHSFTPQLRGRPPRPWQLGLLYAADARLALALAAELRADVGFLEWIQTISGTPLSLGMNQPYDGYLPGDAIDRHATGPGRQNVLLEIRQDLVSTSALETEWAERLAGPLSRALSAAEYQILEIVP